MRIFMTGASGYVGGVIARHLVAAGHSVTALARSEASSAKVAALGALPVPGSLTDLRVLRDSATAADAVVHVAVDFADPRMGDLEEPALDALLSGLGGGKALVYTSTGLVYPDTGGVPVDEDFPVDPRHSPQPYKVHGERQVLAADGTAVTVIRPGLVYGRGGTALLQGMIAGARQQGVVPYVEEGANEWSSVHVDDLAELYAAVLAKSSHGVIVNAASAARTSMRRIAEAVAAVTGTRAVSLTRAQAEQAMGPYAAVLTRSSPLDPSRALRLFGWQAGGPSLLEELRSGSYAGPELTVGRR
ncbi:NAD-dependent epimerase/dehydratase family protein [Amycolatopsis cynarae]|uniref:NAD-dependent epimerase/dehydratase family protein n=1 Tax=Amycolatopsis cynarae TaxID=2995223 RepID=A0ABY7BBS2_9PSEU|nr:NAD-dependent epimerase/dehydratase family protein [Amycolatopsis sp. HUAS 11-8]WAL68578.1 NAD-dependent epimerase/dehydratase family protein [Amycolatopsis sp. HUAS 11-8]